MNLQRAVRSLPILNRSLAARQLAKFLLVGATNTFWDYFLYILLTRGWLGFAAPFWLGQAFSFTGSVANSYILNKRWTFRDDNPRHHVLMTKFFLVNLVTLGLYEILLVVLVGKLRIYDLIAKAIAIVPVTLWNFIANKYWTFRPGKTAENLQKA